MERIVTMPIDCFLHGIKVGRDGQSSTSPAGRLLHCNKKTNIGTLDTTNIAVGTQNPYKPSLLSKKWSCPTASTELTTSVCGFLREAQYTQVTVS